MADIMVQLQKLANENTAKTFKFNKEEAATTRQWQQNMSNTAHQREVKDLIKAGLNPVLSAGGSGAPAYGAQSASGTADSAVNAMGNVASSRTSASAMRYSARQSAAAARYAADRQLSAAQLAAWATKYAADRKSIDNFFSNWSANRRSKYAADVSSETQKWVAVNKQASSYAGLIDKIFGDKNSENSWYKTDIPLFKNGIFGKASRDQINHFSLKAVASAVNNNVRNLMGNTLIRNGFKADSYNIGLLAKTLYYQRPINKNLFHRLDITPNSGRVSRHFFGS